MNTVHLAIFKESYLDAKGPYKSIKIARLTGKDLHTDLRLKPDDHSGDRFLASSIPHPDNSQPLLFTLPSDARDLELLDYSQ